MTVPVEPLVLVTHEAGGVTVVHLHDPVHRNPLTSKMGEQLETALRKLSADPEVRAIVLTGSPPAFSAGGDLSMLESLAERSRNETFDAAPTMHAFYRRFLTVCEVRVPVIAAVNGHAIGAGLCLALACDMRVVASEARFAMNFALLGIHPGMGGSWLLPRLTSLERARELLYTGRSFSGDEAVTYGLALESVPAVNVVESALSIARRVARSAPKVVSNIKRNLAEVDARVLSEALDVEAEEQANDFASWDFIEGIDALRTGRSPQFRGE